MRLWKKASDILVTKFLTIGRNAVLKVTNSNGKAVGVMGGFGKIDAAYAVVEADFGKTFNLSSLTGAAITIPSPVDVRGATLRFVVTTAPTSNGYVITSTGNNIVGAIIPADGGVSTADSGTGLDVLTFVDNQSVLGDRCTLESDGTRWVLTGSCLVATGTTLA